MSKNTTRVLQAAWVRTAGVVALAVVVALVSAGCGESRQPPSQQPALQSWPTPYRGRDGLRVHVFNTGSMVIPAAAVFRGGSWFERRRLDVPAFVIEHPSAGLVVFDTGLSSAVNEDPRAYLGFVTAAVGAVRMPPGADLPLQMKQAGLEPARVRYVVLSHMHFDHTGSAEAFAQATVVSARGEKLAALNEGGPMRYTRTRDWDDVAHWVEIDYATGKPFATFSSHHDLLGDGSVILVDLRGHTPGSQGMLIGAPQGPVLLTGDAAWVDESWHYAAAPISAADMDQWWTQVWRIKNLVRLVPEVLVVAGHDLSRVVEARRDDLTVHAGPALDLASAPRR